MTATATSESPTAAELQGAVPIGSGAVLGRKRVKLRKNDHLHAYWSKRENDLMLYHPLGVQTTSDARVLAEHLNKTLTDELDRRGYDLTTLRFSIAPKSGDERFASQRPNEKS